MTTAHYKGFTIIARTYQVRDTGRWTLDLLIGRHDRLRAFNGSSTYTTEAAAFAGCHEFGRRLIDSNRPGCSLGDLNKDFAHDRDG